MRWHGRLAHAFSSVKKNMGVTPMLPVIQRFQIQIHAGGGTGGTAQCSSGFTSG